MSLKKYCDACDIEIDIATIRPRVEIAIYAPSDGTRMHYWEFCDGCYSTMITWFRGFIRVAGRLQEPKR